MGKNGRHILIVDDEPLVRRSLGEVLTLEGYTVSSASDGEEALRLLNDYRVDVVITDVKMPQMDGVSLLRTLRQRFADLPVIVVTGFGSIESAVEAMKEGASDYISKPIIDTEIKLSISRIIAQQELIEENKDLKDQLAATKRSNYYGIIGQDQKMQKIYNLIDAISLTRATVVLRGESGTGKRMVAQAIHFSNPANKDKPFVEVSCGALPETLLESELFGHIKGSFTGAHRDRVGRFELANGGTILLDEIDAFSPALQVKLLRVLQEGEFERVGDAMTMKVEVRVIAATNQNLEDLIKQGKFREDLYYRLNIINIEIPPLRGRTGDISLLAKYFLDKHSTHINKKIDGIDDNVIERLKHYPWPGNVRELENVIERALILTKGPVITLADLPESLQITQGNGASDTTETRSLKASLRDPEKKLILEALEKSKWNRNETARILGINRTTLYKKMSEHGLLTNNASDGRSIRGKEAN